MISVVVVVLSVLVSDARCDLSFPAGFKFGAATSAYQIEGAWNVSDKGESIWDRLVHTRPHTIKDSSTGDEACSSYENWKQDVKLAAELDVDFYRFSISWSRLLPQGFANYISEDGKNYYNNLIDALLEKGIEPVVTIYHWDLPQRLQDFGGWANPLIADWFADYARIVYSLYADRVKTWITINEPILMCDVPYNVGQFAPAIKDPDFGNYLCAKNVILAHAKAWRIYDKEYKSEYHGKVSLCNQLLWFEPATPDEMETAEIMRQYMVGSYSHPIYSEEGGWPSVIEEKVAQISKEQGYTRSRLPAFTKEEIELVRGTYDFYALNYYTSRLVRKAKSDEEVGPWPFVGAPDLGGVIEISSDWPLAPNGWISIFPEGLRRQMVWLKKNYGDIPIFIMENGYAGVEAGLEDEDRVDYYKKHLEQVLLAIHEDGIDVPGFTAWTLIDNFEWMDGYIPKFGLYEVNFTDPLRTRTPRASALYYKRVIQEHRRKQHENIKTEL